MYRLGIALLALALVPLTSHVAYGALIASESFDYDDSPSNWNGGDGWAKAWEFANDTVQYNKQGLQFSNSNLGIAAFGTGGAVQITITAPKDPLERPLSTPQTIGQTPLYFSLLFKWQVASGERFGFAVYSSSSSSSRGDQVSASFGVYNSDGNREFFARVGSPDSYVQNVGGEPAVDNTYLMIGALTKFNNDVTLELWVVDDQTTSWSNAIHLTAQYTDANNTFSTVDYWSTRIASADSSTSIGERTNPMDGYNGYTGMNILFLDEFRVANDWTTASHTPEPASLVALCGLGLTGGVLALRRKRKTQQEG